MPILTSPPVSNAETERKAQEILYEFYRYWFSNVPRTLGGVTVTFPALAPENFLFNQQEAEPPATGPAIHTVLTDLRPLQQGQSSVTKLVKANALLAIYVRSRNPGTGFQSANNEARYYADALRQIFESGTQALAQLGVHHAKVRRGPVPMPSTGVQVSMLVVTAQLQYSAGY
jgi:hypothetical protein